MAPATSVSTAGLRYGLATAAALVAYGAVYRWAGIPPGSVLAWVFYFMLPAGAWYGVRALRRATGRPLWWRQGAALGTLVSAVGSAIYCVYVYLYNRFVDDSLLDALVIQQRESLLARGFSGDALAEAMGAFERAARPGPFAINVFIALTVFGIVTSALVALVHRRRSQPD